MLDLRRVILQLAAHFWNRQERTVLAVELDLSPLEPRPHHEVPDQDDEDEKDHEWERRKQRNTGQCELRNPVGTIDEAIHRSDTGGKKILRLQYLR